MPLIHSKTPAAFKKNIETEIEHGKPQRQAVAIAYSEKREAEHKRHMAEGGYVKECSMCNGGYADGGSVAEPDPQKAKEMQAGATSAGTTLSEGWENLKEGLGMARGGELGPIREGNWAANEKEPHALDDGGEVEDEIHSMLGEELMSAFESKDRKRVMEGLEALIMSCMNKRGESYD